MGNINTIFSKTAELINDIHDELNTKGYYIQNSTSSQSYSFTVGWAGSPYLINVSYPPYINETADISGYIIETSIRYGSQDTKVSINEAGYKNVRYFTNATDLLSEIKRFSDCVSSDTFKSEGNPYFKPAPQVRPIEIIGSNIDCSDINSEYLNRYYEIEPHLIPIEDKFSVYNADIGCDFVDIS